jgi:hypothetical protein
MLILFVSSNFEISTPQCSTQYGHDGRGDVLDILLHQKIRLSGFIVTDILDSRIKFSILEHVCMREALDPVEKLTDWELFQSRGSELISTNIKVSSSNEANKAARDFAAYVALSYWPLRRKTTILERKYEIPGLHRL